jgi:VIT1/CCC1 family predicted Fe2+/Mn2+ transporter
MSFSSTHVVPEDANDPPNGHHDLSMAKGAGDLEAGALHHDTGLSGSKTLNQQQQQHDPPTDQTCSHKHYSHRAPWLRALVLGANDGLVSIASLMLGVGAVNSGAKEMMVSGLAGLVAGACSMAIGEFVSVFSQRDSEKADVEKERQVNQPSKHTHPFANYH